MPLAPIELSAMSPETSDYEHTEVLDSATEYKPSGNVSSQLISQVELNDLITDDLIIRLLKEADEFLDSWLKQQQQQQKKTY